MAINDFTSILRQKSLDLSPSDPQASLKVLQSVRRVQTLLRSAADASRRIVLEINTDEERILKDDLRYDDFVITVFNDEQELRLKRPCTIDGLYTIGAVLELEMQRRDMSEKKLECAVAQIQKAFDGFQNLKQYIADSGLEKARGLRLYIQTNPAQFANGQTQKDDIVLQIPRGEGNLQRMRFACSAQELERCRTLVDYIYQEWQDSDKRNRESEHQETARANRERQAIRYSVERLQLTFKNFNWKLSADWKTDMATVELVHLGRTIRTKLPINQAGCQALELLVKIEEQRRGGSSTSQTTTIAIPNSAVCYKRIKALMPCAQNLKCQLKLDISVEDAEAGRTGLKDITLSIPHEGIELHFCCDYAGYKTLSANLELLELLRKSQRKDSKKKKKSKK